MADDHEYHERRYARWREERDFLEARKAEEADYKTYQEIIRDADAERAAENARRDRAGDRGILLVLVVTVCILGIAFAF